MPFLLLGGGESIKASMGSVLNEFAEIDMNLFSGSESASMDLKFLRQNSARNFTNFG